MPYFGMCKECSAHGGQRRASDFSGAGVTGGCHLPNRDIVRAAETSPQPRMNYFQKEEKKEKNPVFSISNLPDPKVGDPESCLTSKFSTPSSHG